MASHKEVTAVAPNAALLILLKNLLHSVICVRTTIYHRGGRIQGSNRPTTSSFGGRRHEWECSFSKICRSQSGHQTARRTYTRFVPRRNIAIIQQRIPWLAKFKKHAQQARCNDDGPLGCSRDDGALSPLIRSWNMFVYTQYTWEIVWKNEKWLQRAHLVDFQITHDNDLICQFSATDPVRYRALMGTFVPCIGYYTQLIGRWSYCTTRKLKLWRARVILWCGPMPPMLARHLTFWDQRMPESKCINGLKWFLRLTMNKRTWRM